MERKRKLPARAAARQEHVAKKRTITPPEKEKTPAPTPAPEPIIEEPPAPAPPPPPLPKSVQPGKPLPTVEEPQAENLPAKEFQTIQESGVMAESIRRSRHKWMTEFIFEKYWTKPSKRKGVVNEDPKNPPKDSMTKLGQVTITIEPHVFDATLYAVKDPRPPPPMPVFRPILQYGPPGGSMPPPTTIRQTPETTSQETATPKPAAPDSAIGVTTQAAVKQEEPPSNPPPVRESPKPTPPPGPVAATPPTPAPVVLDSQPPAPSASNTPRTPSFPPRQSSSTPTFRPPTSSGPVGPTPPRPAPAPTPAPAASPAPGQANNAVIATLAERASSDDRLKELMKKVAEGNADKAELSQFQRVIDQINEEHNRKTVQGPPPDKVFVDGRSLKYFAEEVRSILHIVLTSNPAQKSNNLRPPPGSDPLIIMLVQAALDDAKLKAAIQRIASGKPEYNDTNQLKGVLDGLHKKLMLEKMKKEQKEGPQTPVPATPNGTANGAPSGSHSQPTQQALRSKGPPPQPKPDIAAVVVEFSGGSGDRYLFPKHSILEYRGTQQVVASFLLVRKSSKSEHGGDRELDYYEPITIRITAPSGRYLENLARVVAPQDEVRRYMDDIMKNMTRAQYVLLAWRLMRDKAGEKEDDEVNTNTNGTTSKLVEGAAPAASSKPAVLWTAKVTPPAEGPKKAKLPVAMETDDDKYQKLVQSAAAKETEE